MNRRTVLQSAGVLATVGLAGCVEGVQEHFQGSIQGIIPVEIHNETDQSYNVQLEAYDLEADRQTYDEAYSVTPDEMVTAPNLERTAQSLRVTTYERDTDADTFREVSLTPNTELVLIYLRDDGPVIDVQRRGSDGGENATDGSDANAGRPDEDGEFESDETTANASDETDEPGRDA